MTIAVQEAFEDRGQEEEDSESEIFQDANSESEDDENSSKPFMIRFFSFLGSFRKQKEIDTKPNDEIQRYLRPLFPLTFSSNFFSNFISDFCVHFLKNCSLGVIY